MVCAFKGNKQGLDSGDCPLEAGVAFLFDLVQLWLLPTSSSHARAQGCGCSLSTVREVEVPDVDAEKGGEWSGSRLYSVLRVLAWLHVGFLFFFWALSWLPQASVLSSAPSRLSFPP